MKQNMHIADCSLLQMSKGG